MNAVVNDHSEFDMAADLLESLDFKAMETLERLIRQRDQGVLTESEFVVGVNTLFQTVSGIMDEDFIELVTKADADVNRNDPSFVRRRTFVSPKTGAVIVLRADPKTSTLRYYNSGNHQVKKYDFGDKPERLGRALRRLAENTLEIGYVEL